MFHILIQFSIDLYIESLLRRIYKCELMKHNDFKVIYDRLNEPADITKLSQELGLDLELLDVIFTQRTVRETTKSFYKVQRNAQKLVYDWNHGLTLLEVARKWNFPPILTGLMIYQVSGRSKKQFWNMVRNADTIMDESLRLQIQEISEEDLVYSPSATEKQYKRGTWGEEKLQCWLDGQNIILPDREGPAGRIPEDPRLPARQAHQGERMGGQLDRVQGHLRRQGRSEQEHEEAARTVPANFSDKAWSSIGSGSSTR